MSRRHEVGVGVLVVVAGTILAWMAIRVGALRQPGDTVDIDVRLTDAAGLSAGAVVSIAGVPVGRVERVGLDGVAALARVSLDPVAAIRADARIAIRARSLLGEKYLEVVPDPQSQAPLLADGDRVEGVGAQVEADELVAAMAPVVEALDPAAVRAFSKAIADDPDRAVRMLDDAETILSNARVASETLPELVDEVQRTLRQVRATTRAAGPAIARIENASTRLDTLLAAVPPERLPEVLAELQAAVREGRAVLQRVDGSASDLQQLLAKANRITKDDLDRFARSRGVYVRFVPKAFDPPEP
jgi:virulence factor Mce-like protein